MCSIFCCAMRLIAKALIIVVLAAAARLSSAAQYPASPTLGRAAIVLDAEERVGPGTPVVWSVRAATVDVAAPVPDDAPETRFFYQASYHPVFAQVSTLTASAQMSVLQGELVWIKTPDRS